MKFDKQIKKILDDFLERTRFQREEQISSMIVGIIEETYLSSDTLTSFDRVSEMLRKEKGGIVLATPAEIVTNLVVEGRTVTFDLSEPHINRTFRALELYGNSPYKKIKSKLSKIGVELTGV